jgi:hypothetical protein
MQRCETHSLDYPQTFFPRVEGQEGFWTGTCPGCEAEEKLSARVDKLLAERQAEKWQRVDAIMLKRAPEIERAIDESMDEEREERRAEWRDFHEAAIRLITEARVHQEMRAEILEQLRKGA